MRVFTLAPSPIGDLTVYSDGKAVTGLWMQDDRIQPPSPDERNDNLEVLKRASLQLNEYFQGSRREFDLPIAPEGPEFHQKVWKALLDIPYGSTCTYGDLARRLGSPLLARAVGLANGRNPISIIVPCHRVIGANGKLVGYGGGLWRKEWLLKHESGSPALFSE